MSEQQPTPESVRDATGTIVDQTKPVESKAPETTTPTETPKAIEPTPVSKDSKSLLNQTDDVVPDKYSDFKVPEGYELDGEVSKEASALFKDMKLSQGNAQKLVDFYIKQTQESNDAPYKLWEQTQEEWRNAIARDPEIGGKLPQVKQAVGRMLDALGDPGLANDFRTAMDFTGAGNNPAFIRTMYRLALRLTEGQHVSGNAPSEAGQNRPGSRPTSAAKAMYPNLP